MIWAAALPEAREWAGAAVRGRKLGKGSLVTPAVPPGDHPGGGGCDSCRPWERAASDGTHHLIAPGEFSIGL